MPLCNSCSHFDFLLKKCHKDKKDIHQNSDVCAMYDAQISPISPEMTLFEKDLDEVLSDMKAFLMQKNKAYGDSALNPIRVFSKADPLEQIKVRMDDKLSRFARGSEYPGDNDEKDFCGYSLLLRIARLREERAK